LTAQHLTAEPPPPSEALPGLPAAVDDAVLAQLSKDPEQRAPSASAAVAQLSRAFSGAAVSARPAPARRESKPPRWILPLALVVVGFAGAFTFMALRPKPEPPAARPATQAARSAAVAVAPEPAPVTSVTLTVNGSPKTARVFHAGQELGRLGVPFQVARSSTPLTLTVKAAGYADQTLEPVPSADLELAAKLKRTAPAKPSTELEY
jgi:hypothetical protein